MVRENIYTVQYLRYDGIISQVNIKYWGEKKAISDAFLGILLFSYQKHYKPRTDEGFVYIHSSFQNSNLLPYGKKIKITKIT